MGSEMEQAWAARAHNAEAALERMMLACNEERVRADNAEREAERLRGQVARFELWADDQAQPWPDGTPDREGEALREGALAALAVPVEHD